jgi:hypothetical protein
MTLKIITMTAYRRPSYTREVLQALARCHGVADWLFLPHVEPGNETVIELCKSFDACESNAEINPERKGLNRNTQAAICNGASRRPDILVHLEDDTVPAPDALLYFQFAVNQMAAIKNKKILIASGYNKTPCDVGKEYTANLRKIWSPWGWATNLVGLEFLLNKWCFRNPKCFTCFFRRVYRNARYEIYPLLSRIQNIGYELGENNRKPEWYRANHRSLQVADEETPVQDFVLGLTNPMELKQ